ncbi:MAG TPA: hypothetical protein VK253_05260 [Candidatus Binatia bacterium]|nr:hypothetical protein [Candidatus Binatia bacterium]
MIGPTLEELSTFTLNNYIKLLRYLKETFHVVRFCEAPRYDSYLILRHDIDYSPEVALSMARLEQGMGIKATYFALLYSTSYDATDGRIQNTLKEISRLGHEIGLHYLPLQYQSYKRPVNDTLQLEVEMLEKISGQKIHTISRHGIWDRDPFFSVRGLINANHPYWRSDLFVHESCRAWYPVEGLVKLLKFPPRRAQLLIHPDNWTFERIDRTELIDRLLQSTQACQLEKQNLREIWMTDPLVSEFDRKLGERSQIQDLLFDVELGMESDSSVKRELKYYKNLVNWYLVNSRVGWWCHNIISRVRGQIG